MIFETETTKTAEVVGDIKNNNVSIDTSNIDFIVTILSTNLYSKPIESFIRETVSNAWDSHVEAGVDDPVILELGKDTEGTMFCRIQDFGVGLSPERFDNVYKNIGSSTKRADNKQIGGFGIGRFSALAYSDVIHITSVYEGKKYSYMMYKDGNTVSIDLLNTQDTSERNGLEVKLEIKYGDFNNFARAIKSQLVYFENLYIIDGTTSKDDLAYGNPIDIEREYNNFKIKKYNHFWVNTLDNSRDINLVLGKVRYPLRIDSLSKSYAQKIKEYPISLVFEIGDLEVTPNREEVLYSEKNRLAIEKKLDLALEEIKDLMDNQGTTDVNKISEYLEEIKETKYLILLESDTDKVRLKLTSQDRRITLQGQEYAPKAFEELYNLVMSYGGITSQYFFANNQIKYVNNTLSLNTIKSAFDKVYFADLGDVKNISKRYIRETFLDSTYFIKVDKDIMTYAKEYMSHIKNLIAKDKGAMYPRHPNLKEFDLKAFKVIFKNIVKNLGKVRRFDDSKVSNKWIKDTKAADAAKRGNIKKQGFDWKQNINFHKLRSRDYGGGVMTESMSQIMEGIDTKFKKLTIYAEKDNETIRTLYSYLKHDVRPNLVEVASTKLKLLKDIDNFVTIEDFMSTDYALLRNIGTVQYLEKEFPELRQVAKISNLSDISPKLADVVAELNKFVYRYEGNTSRLSDDEQTLVNDIYQICEDKNYFNEHIRGLYNQNKEELQNVKIFLMFVERSYSSVTPIPKDRVNLLIDYLLARKLVRPSVQAVLKLKKETIFNLKPEENEINEN